MQTLKVPTGTITFLFTDIEGSTRLWENYPNEMSQALALHDRILRQTIEINGGYVFKTVGDAFCAAFQSASEALTAAIAIQRKLKDQVWPTPSPIKVRMGLHTGTTEERDNDFFGPTLNRLSRLFSAGHGGQTLLSATTAQLLKGNLPQDVSLRDLGWHRFKDLNELEQVYQVDALDLPQDFAPLKSLDLAINNLPIDASQNQLIGRDKEIAEISQLLRQKDTRLVTLTGIGGTGKTRLSLAVAHHLRTEFEAGVCFVPLEKITQRELLIEELANILKIKDVAGQPLLDTLKTYLKDKQLLLVLDNFEQLVEQGASVLAELLKATSKLKLLVTSRELLQLSFEKEYSVEALALPPLPKLEISPETLSNYAAVALFVERAQLVKPDFKLTEENAYAIAAICHKLDGLPLAIELAAPRIKLLSPNRLLELLSDRLKLLTGGAKDLPERQQTIRGAIDWSYNLLDATEQELFVNLAIFVGGCTLESVEEVCIANGDITLSALDGIEALTNKSLLKQKEDVSGEIRFVMLPLIRDYALAKLNELSNEQVARIEQHYVAYFAKLAGELESKLYDSKEQLTALRKLDSEYNNLRNAFERAITNSLLHLNLLRLGRVLGDFWHVRGHFYEGRVYLQRILAISDIAVVDRANYAKVIRVMARLASAQGDWTESKKYALESLALSRELNDKAEMAFALTTLGQVEQNNRNYTQALRYLEESLALNKEIANKREIAVTLQFMANIITLKGDYNKGQKYYEESLDLLRELGDKTAIILCIANLAVSLANQGNYDLAQNYFEENLTLSREIGNKQITAHSLYNLGLIASSQKKYDIAQSYYEESLALEREIGNKYSIANILNNIATLFTSKGDYEQAKKYFDEGISIRIELGDNAGLATILNNLSVNAIEQGEYVQAQKYLIESLSLRREVGDKYAIAYSLVSFIYLLSHKKEVGEAATKAWQGIATISGAIRALLDSLKMELQPVWQEYYEKSTEVARSGLGEETFELAFAQGQTMSVDVAVDYTQQWFALS